MENPPKFEPIVAIAYPPNLEEIIRVFGRDKIINKPILFAWGDTIFNPLSVPISKPLFFHEAVHGIRQGSQIEEWWKLYLSNPKFRLTEEIEAHREEWRQFKREHKDRNRRSSYLVSISRRLSSPLYGSMIDFTQAKREIDA